MTTSSQASDRFAIESRVGGGASGDIFRAIDQQTGNLVALKVLRGNSSSMERQRFEREVKVLAELRHPSIVGYVSHGARPDGRLFLAMEWLDGEDLSKRQRRNPLGTRDAVEVVRRAAQAMAAVHARGIVHRDLKLSNMYLVHGKHTAVKLIDFGVVKPGDDMDFETEQGTILGTPHYMAPEQARGEDVTPAADVYALGSVLFRLLTGRNVFETEHVIALLGRLVLEDPPRPSQFRFDIPDRLDAVVHRALAREPAVRFPHAGEFARALARVGQLNNDPPQVERSASAVRPVAREDTGESVSIRTSLRMRRVVACMLYDLGDTTTDRSLSENLVELAGEDGRIEELADGMTVAVLGVEHSRGDEAMRAARAALAMIGDFPEARAVVSVGHAVAARSNLAGEALDRAARQLERAAPGTVRLDQYALAALERRFEIRRDAEGGELIREDPRDLGPRKVLGRVTPTVGREKEITELLGAFHATIADASPRAALVLGAPGIGKSRVRSELVQRLEMVPQPPEIMICRGETPDGSGGSIPALGKALRSMMGVQDGASLKDQVAKVKDHVRSGLPRSLHFLAAFLGELVGVAFPDHADEPLRAARANDQLMQSRIRMALEAYLRTHAGRRPQVVIIEDGHLCDDTSLDLIAWLLACPDIRFVAYAFAQSELTRRRPDLWQRAQRVKLTLGPIPPAMAERIVHNALPEVPVTRVRELVRRAAGNPFVLEELVRCFHEDGDELPLTVQALVQLRLDRLQPTVRETLRAASVFGQTFWTGGVSALLDRAAGEDLAAAEREEFIIGQPSSSVAGEAEWIFRQALVREAAHATLLEEDRLRLHLAAGEWLEASGSVDLGIIAGHFEVGGDHDRAAGLYARATQQLLANAGQMDAALELARRGLACGAVGGERAQLLLTQAQVWSQMGQVEDCIGVADEASKLVPPRSEMWVQAMRLIGNGLIEAGRAEEGVNRLAAALQSDHPLPAPLSSILTSAQVRGLADLGRKDEARAIAAQAVELAQGAGTKGEAAYLRALDAQVYAFLIAGFVDPGIKAAHALIEAADRVGDAHLASRGRINAASSLNYLGRFEEAQSLLEHALPDVRALRFRTLEASCLQNLSMSHARRGFLDDGLELLRHAIAIAEECRSQGIVLNSRIYETMFLVWRGAPGDLKAAHDTAEQVGAQTASHGSLRIVGLFARAFVQKARLRYEEAHGYAAEAYRLLATTEVEETEEQIRLLHIELLLTLGREDEADEALQTTFSALRERVRRLQRPDLRHSYVHRNAEVARLLGLAKQRLQLEL